MVMSVGGATFRQVMGQFATGVTIVTTRDGETVHGMTVNAFTSLSLNPPLVLICIDQNARTKPVLDAGGVFAINVLAEDQIEISRLFASPDVDIAGRFHNVSYHDGVTGSPLIEGCIAFLECRTVATYPGGDHTVYVGEVESASLGAAARPLLFYQGKYRAMEE